MFFFLNLTPVPHQTWRTPRRIWIVLFYSKFLQIFDPHGGNVLTTHIATGFFGREPVTSIPKSVNISGRPKFIVIHFAIPKTVVLANKKHRSNVKTPFASLLLVMVFWLIAFLLIESTSTHSNSSHQSPWQATKKSKKHLPQSCLRKRQACHGCHGQNKKTEQHQTTPATQKSAKKKHGDAHIDNAFFGYIFGCNIDGLNKGWIFATRSKYLSPDGASNFGLKKRGTHDNTCS